MKPVLTPAANDARIFDGFVKPAPTGHPALVFNN
jgi:hypothetical protein